MQSKRAQQARITLAIADYKSQGNQIKKLPTRIASERYVQVQCHLSMNTDYGQVATEYFDTATKNKSLLELLEEIDNLN